MSIKQQAFRFENGSEPWRDVFGFGGGDLGTRDSDTENVFFVMKSFVNGRSRGRGGGGGECVGPDLKGQGAGAA